MVDWRTVIIQIVLPLLSSGLIISAFTSFYNDIYNKPNLQIKILHNDVDRNISTIKVTNQGRLPANNLMLTVETPANIIDYNIFNTENVTVLNTTANNPKLLELYVPRLVQGEGSIIKIVMLMNIKKTTEYDDYNIYVTYDEGSIRITPSRTLSISRGFFDVYGEWLPSIAFVVTGIATSIPYLIIVFGRIGGKRHKVHILSLIKYVKIIDSIYSTFQPNTEQCSKRLYEIQKEITDLFKNGRMTEVNYKLLNKKISVYISALEHGYIIREKELTDS
jgi:hypothetical protein